MQESPHATEKRRGKEGRREEEQAEGSIRDSRAVRSEQDLEKDSII